MKNNSLNGIKFVIAGIKGEKRRKKITRRDLRLRCKRIIGGNDDTMK